MKSIWKSIRLHHFTDIQMAKVTIASIAVSNLGPFRERQYLDLRVSEAKPAVLIKALNGSGKTTLLTALQICLYGYRAINTARRSQFEQLVTSLQRREAVGPSLVEVTLAIEIAGSKRVIEVSREFVVKKTFSEKITVVVDGIQDSVLAENWEEFIEGILPAELVQLFFFDGEKIESLANPERLPDLLRRATEVFLGIGGIDAVTNDLRAVERRALLRHKDNVDPFSRAKAELNALEAQADQLRANLEMQRQAQANTRNGLDQARFALEKYIGSSKKNGLMSFQQAAEIRSQAAQATLALKGSRSVLVEALSSPLLPVAWVSKLWSDYAERWTDEQRNLLSAQILNEIRKHDRRVLSALSSKTPSAIVEVLKKTMDEDAPASPRHSQFHKRFLDGANPPDVTSRVTTSVDTVRASLKGVAETRRLLDKAEKAINTLPAEDQLTTLVTALGQHTKDVSDAEAKFFSIAQTVNEGQLSLDHIEMKINAARNRMNVEFRERSLEAKGLEAAIRARQVIASFKDKLLASKATWLSEMITAEFRLLLRKKHLVSYVQVDPVTYKVSICGAERHEIPMDRLSAGERQLLAIAVLSALIKERKGRFPVVVDTPLARLDRDHRESLIQRFFTTVSHQVLILATDEEVTGTVYEALKPSTSQEYILQFDDIEGRTSVLDTKFAVPKMMRVA